MKFTARRRVNCFCFSLRQAVQNIDRFKNLPALLRTT